jgi:hypothetical protein
VLCTSRCRRKFKIIYSSLLICAHFNEFLFENTLNEFIFGNTLWRLVNSEQVLLDIMKIGHYFSKRVLEGFSYPFYPAGTFSSSGKEKVRPL